MNTDEQIKMIKKDIFCLQDSITSNSISLKKELEYLKKDLHISFMLIQFFLGVALTLAGISFFVK